MALFLLTVHKYGHVSFPELPVRLGLRSETRFPQRTAFQGPVARAAGVRKAEGSSANGNPHSWRAVLSFQFVSVAGSLWAVGMTCLFWESTRAPGVCHPLFSPAVWSCLQCSQEHYGFHLELKQRNESSWQESKRCQPCSVLIQPHHARML